jgi:hypothetical protein
MKPMFRPGDLNPVDESDTEIAEGLLFLTENCEPSVRRIRVFADRVRPKNGSQFFQARVLARELIGSHYAVVGRMLAAFRRIH